jgi:CRP/FNR family transcriptional regulator, polysaccharide utilization system transcription regulator
MQFSNKYIEFCLEGPASVFRGLGQKEKETLVGNHKVYHIKRGHPVFTEGEKAHGLLCLASGKVKLFREGVGGRNQILMMKKPLDLFGFRSLFGDQYMYMSADAVEDSTICVLEKSPLIKILKKNADLSFLFAKLLSEELKFSNNRIISLTQKHVRGRVAESILMLSDVYGFEEDGRTIGVSLSREDIAGLSSMTTSNAIRTLSNFVTDGLITLKGRRITLTNQEALESISELG